MDQQTKQAHESPDDGDKEMLDAGDIVRRLCHLQAEVYEVVNGDHPADCFCGVGGYWSSAPDHYGPTYKQGYRNSGEALKFIEQAVREKIQSIKQ